MLPNVEISDNLEVNTSEVELYIADMLSELSNMAKLVGNEQVSSMLLLTKTALVAE